MKTPKLHFLLGLAFAGCVGSNDATDDESMYLTGTEESAVTLANGQKACSSPKKTLICHIPPGNPGNAHDICVGNAAVEPHQKQHGDTIGACPTPPGGGGGDGSGSGSGGGDGSGSGSGSGGDGVPVIP